MSFTTRTRAMNEHAQAAACSGTPRCDSNLQLHPVKPSRPGMLQSKVGRVEPPWSPPRRKRHLRANFGGGEISRHKTAHDNELMCCQHDHGSPDNNMHFTSTQRVPSTPNVAPQCNADATVSSCTPPLQRSRPMQPVGLSRRAARFPSAFCGHTHVYQQSGSFRTQAQGALPTVQAPQPVRSARPVVCIIRPG